MVAQNGHNLCILIHEVMALLVIKLDIIFSLSTLIFLITNYNLGVSNY